MAEERIPVSLVLGSGGARGLAHIGVIQALGDEGGYEIRSITGSSIGALIGGLHAADRLAPYAEWVRGLSRGDVWGLLDFSFTSRGLFEGERLMNKLRALVGDARIEELPIPFTAVASDIERRQEVWLNHGSLFDAIRASIAIPGLFTPVLRDGRLLVDGGLLSPLPIAPSVPHDADRRIVVSLNGTAERRHAKPGDDARAGEAPASGSALRRWIGRPRLARELEAPAAEPVSAFEIMARSLAAMQDRIARYQMAAYRPDVLIEIPIDACGVLDFHRAGKMIELGYRRARAALRVAHRREDEAEA
jgi:NTE family protein